VTPPHGPLPESPVRFPVMLHRWESATFLHWSYPAEMVAGHLPPELRVEPWEGRAWVSVVLFRMYVRVPAVGWSVVPPFPETNLRTYVVGPDGTPGIWFWSLDAASPSAVAAARSLYGLPYFYGRMAVEDAAAPVRYIGRRRRPGPVGTGYDLEVEPGRERPAAELSEFDHYLTARFTLWNRHGPMLLRTPVEHGAWTIRDARVTRLDQALTDAAGLPRPEGDPLVHYSPGVDVRIAPPRLRVSRS